MPRSCLVFAFALSSLFFLPSQLPAQPNSEQSSQVPGRAPEPPIPPKAVKDSVKAARAKSKKAKKPVAASADSTRAAGDTSRTGVVAPKTGASAGPANQAGSTTNQAAAPVPTAPQTRAADSAKAAAPVPAPVTPSVAPDSAKGRAAIADSSKAPADLLEVKPEPKRIPPDIRLFNDPPLIGREYGFGILGSVVASTLGFFIGSGLETAIVGEADAHKGTLSFTGIRYDNFKGAFWGGATGMVLGSTLTTYFTGQTEEEDGGVFATLVGTTAAAAGAFYLASLAGVNDEIDWKPFIPLLAVPSLGGTLGFNVSRWLHDRKREEVISKEAAVRLHAPSLALGFGPRGERVEISALRLTF